MATRNELIEQIKFHLGFKTTQDATIVKAMKLAQVQLESAPVLPWFLRSELSTVNTAVDEERVPLPSGFIRMCEDSALWWFDSSASVDEQWTKLTRGVLDVLRLAYQSKTGKPESYDLDALYFRIFPLADAVYPLKLIYYKKAEVLDTNISNVWTSNYPDILTGNAGKRIAIPNRDKTAFAAFAQMEQLARIEMSMADTAREEENSVTIMGGDD